jgi:hypothetical protein
MIPEPTTPTRLIVTVRDYPGAGGFPTCGYIAAGPVFRTNVRSDRLRLWQVTTIDRM